MQSAYHIAKLDCCSGVRTAKTLQKSLRVLFLRRPTFVPVCCLVSQATAAPTQQVQKQQNTFRDLLKSFQFYKNTVNLRYLDQLHQLVVLLQKHPELTADVWKAEIVPTLIKLKDCGRLEVEHQARLALALLGYAPPCSGRGIRILSVDGGGTRWVWQALYFIYHFSHLLAPPPHFLLVSHCRTFYSPDSEKSSGNETNLLLSPSHPLLPTVHLAQSNSQHLLSSLLSRFAQSNSFSRSVSL